MDSPSQQILSAMGGMKVISYYIISQGIGFSLWFHFIFPSVGRLQVRRGRQDRHVQMQNAWCDTVWHQPSCSRSPVHAASHLSCISHLKVTLYPWKEPKNFSCLKGFKAGFILALCHNLIKAVTAKAGWFMDSPMPALRQLVCLPFCPSTLDMVFSCQYYWD